MKYFFVINLMLFIQLSYAQEYKPIINLSITPNDLKTQMRPGQNCIKTALIIDGINLSTHSLEDSSTNKLKYPKKDEIANYKLSLRKKDSSLFIKYGLVGFDAVISIETKPFVKHRYWELFKSRSEDYNSHFKTPESDSIVLYILNGVPLYSNIEKELSFLTDSNLKNIAVLDKLKLQNQYRISEKQYGILVSTVN